MASKASSKDKIAGISDYQWSYTEEPHASRRKVILQDHKEIKSLMGYDSRQAYFALSTVVIQLTMAFYCGKPTCPWWVFVSVAWIIGGTCVHSITLAIHELSHNLFFKKRLHNVLYGYFCNIPMVVPYSATFKKYHIEHHKKQGHDGVDTDIPTAWEGRFFTTPFRKFLWVFFQVLFYALRPTLSNPKRLNKWDIYNIITQVCAMSVIYIFFGIWSIAYLLLSMFLGLGPHPCAGHFIAEHYTGIWTGGNHTSGFTPIKAGGKNLQIDETFTYRGPLNWVSYNVGVHAAHHDFPNVPGSRLFELEKMAPEYYNHLPECKSWPGTIWRYIFSEGNPFDRIKRPNKIYGKVTENTNTSVDSSTKNKCD